MKWIIYCHLNKINRKRYIGQTSKKCTKYRFVKNGNGYSRQPKFYNAIKKYGWDNFEHIILEDNIKTQEEANLREQYYIKKYNTIKDGYNCTEGGNTAASYVKSQLISILLMVFLYKLEKAYQQQEKAQILLLVA